MSRTFLPLSSLPFYPSPESRVEASLSRTLRLYDFFFCKSLLEILDKKVHRTNIAWVILYGRPLWSITPPVALKSEKKWQSSFNFPFPQFTGSLYSPSEVCRPSEFRRANRNFNLKRFSLEIILQCFSRTPTAL